MFYEEPECAKLIQLRFLKNRLTRGECAVYVVDDEQDLPLIKTAMVDYGIDFDNYSKRGLLHLPVKENIQSLDDFKRAYGAIFEGMAKKFFNYFHQKSLPQSLPPIRGVGIAIPNAFVAQHSYPHSTATAQLQIERFFHNGNRHSFNGTWMCHYQVDNIEVELDKQWMEDMLNSHDAMIFLRKLSNGLALDLRK